MKTPALTAADKSAAAFDVGGTAVCVARLDGTSAVVENTDTVITAALNADGWLALCTEASGYKGRVTVYNSDLKAVYQWNSGEGYLLSARVSPDDKYLAALCAGSGGCVVHLFALSSTKEQASYTAAGTLFIDMDWLETGRLFLLGQTGCAVIDRAGALKGSYDFGGQYLTNYAFGGDGYAVLMFAKGRLLGLQFDTLFTGGLYEKTARREVELALRIRRAFEDKGFALYYDSPTNQQFPILPAAAMEKLSENYTFSVWAHLGGGRTAVRFCTSFATRAEDVDALIADIRDL